MVRRFLPPTQSIQGKTQIVMRHDVIGLDSQSIFIMPDGIAWLPLAQEHICQIVVRHPTLGIFRQGIAPERFQILINASLLPSEYPKYQQHYYSDGRSHV